MQTPLLPPYHYPILFQCSNLHLLYLSIIALSYSHAKPIYPTSLSLSYLIPMLKMPRTTASEYIQPNSSPYISHCCGGWKASQRLWNLHLRNQPSLPSTPFHREGAFRPFLLPTHISKQTNVLLPILLSRRAPTSVVPNICHLCDQRPPQTRRTQNDRCANYQ